MAYAQLLASWPRMAAVLTALAAMTGCGDDRTATSAGTLYHCVSASDCLAGYACTCNFCQLPGNQVGCDAGQDAAADAFDAASPADTTADALDASQPADTMTDVGPIKCNLVDWTPCPVGQGCYCLDGLCSDKDKTVNGLCGPHGNLGLDAKCDPTAEECAVGKVDGVSRPLRCDTVDKKCYPTCNCMQPALYPCRAAEQCYCLEDSAGAFWPDDAGICAPKL